MHGCSSSYPFVLLCWTTKSMVHVFLARGITRMSDTSWLSTEQIATHLGVKRDTIYKRRIRHGMPAHKVGKLWKFSKTEVDRWVTSGEAGKRNEVAFNGSRQTR